ncbi:hypothetical protein Tco_0111071 [Tanacetum coccineum]
MNGSRLIERIVKIFGHSHDTCTKNVSKPDPNDTTKADHSDGFTEVKRKKNKGRKVDQLPKSRNSSGDGVPKPKPTAFRHVKVIDPTQEPMVLYEDGNVVGLPDVLHITNATVLPVPFLPSQSATKSLKICTRIMRSVDIRVFE